LHNAILYGHDFRPGRKPHGDETMAIHTLRLSDQHDFRAFSEQSESAPVVERAKQIKAETRDMQITVGVDRLDYTKGFLSG